MRGIHHGTEVVEVAEFGIHTFVVGHGIIAAQLSFAVEFGNGMDGHEPQYIDAKLGQAWNVAGEFAESPAVGVLAGVYLINHCVCAPRSMGGSLCRCTFRSGGLVRTSRKYC